MELGSDLVFEAQALALRRLEAKFHGRGRGTYGLGLEVEAFALRFWP